MLQFPSTQEINHIVRNTITDPTKYIGMEFCPMVDVFSRRIEVDVIEATTGMTKAHNLNGAPSMVTLSGQSTKIYSTGYWKETYRMNEEELLFAREEGTYNQRAGRIRVVRRASELNTRLETRLEWLRWQPVVGGKIDVNENNVKYTVDYKVPAKNKPTLDWSDPTHNIISDIEDLLLVFRGTGAQGKTVYINHGVAKLLANNEGIKNLLKSSIYATTLSPRTVVQAMNFLFPGLEWKLYDQGFGDASGNFTSFVPDNKFIILGEGAPGEKLMDFASTISLHNGGLDKPQPGKFSMIVDKSQASNPFLDITVGIYGLPRVFHPNWIVSATVA
ncbi:major capsid protein [Aneurinibacillus sp. Ricciae_BoGa-3]|uniref:major capsid protein n=1 Tax=Aneurinibacillus sp. Ricciae_BoGa-3 TaxID=3022697 RepID=UPI00234045AA|nr:major capsid protein [Aneurinibacillus sp. Ricciae_BoGa-3]WCK55425.1 major capsid protein [Aneurinibacillus sp. Ricciae_BoGa-3]